MKPDRTATGDYEAALRERILTAPDLAYEDIEVPEWGTTVRVREASAGEYARFSLAVHKGTEDDATLWGFRFLTWVTLDPATETSGSLGDRVFTDDDAEALAGKNSEAINRLTEVAFRLSRLRVTTEDAAKN